MKDEYEAKPYLGTYYYVINATRESGAARRKCARRWRWPSTAR